MHVYVFIYRVFPENCFLCCLCTVRIDRWCSIKIVYTEGTVFMKLFTYEPLFKFGNLCLMFTIDKLNDLSLLFTFWTFDTRVLSLEPLILSLSGFKKYSKFVSLHLNAYVLVYNSYKPAHLLNLTVHITCLFFNSYFHSVNILYIKTSIEMCSQSCFEYILCIHTYIFNLLCIL